MNGVEIFMVVIIGISFIAIGFAINDWIGFVEYRTKFCEGFGYDGFNEGASSYEGYCYNIEAGKILTKDFHCINLIVGQKHECFLQGKE